MTALAVLEPLPEAPAINLTAIAKECIDGTENQSLAIDKFYERVLGDALLLEEVVGRHLRGACARIIWRTVAMDNRVLKGVPAVARPRRLITAGEFAGAATQTWLDYRICGRRIGGMTRSDLLLVAGGLDTQVASLGVQSKWMKLIAADMPGDRETVDEALTGDRLEALHEKALGGA